MAGGLGPPLAVQLDVMPNSPLSGSRPSPVVARGLAPRGRVFDITLCWTLAAAAVSDGVVPAPPSSSALPFGWGNPAPGVFASLCSALFLDGLSVRDAIRLSALHLDFPSPGSSILRELHWSLMELHRSIPLTRLVKNKVSLCETQYAEAGSGGPRLVQGRAIFSRPSEKRFRAS
jgi:hypothetical protein